MHAWQTTVTELMQIFCDAIIALAPILQRANVRWQEPPGDDWDTICTCLFGQLVEGSVFYGLGGIGRPGLQFSKYDFTYDDYAHVSFIRVQERPTHEHILVFQSFVTRNSPFDTIKCCIIRADTYRATGHYTFPSTASSTYCLDYVTAAGVRRTVEALTVEL